MKPSSFRKKREGRLRGQVPRPEGEKKKEQAKTKGYHFSLGEREASQLHAQPLPLTFHLSLPFTSFFLLLLVVTFKPRALRTRETTLESELMPKRVDTHNMNSVVEALTAVMASRSWRRSCRGGSQAMMTTARCPLLRL